MYIKTLKIKNYRNFGGESFQIDLKPFTLIVGENNIGKTNLLNAIALLFGQEVGIFQRRILEIDDFNYATVAAFKKQVTNVDIPLQEVVFPEIIIEATLVDFDSDQEAVIGDWFADTELKTAKVTYKFSVRASFDRQKWIDQQRQLLGDAADKHECDGAASEVKSLDWKQVEFPISDYRYAIFGGGVENNECETHWLRMIRAEILDALRDARRELMAGGDQRVLYKVLRHGVDNEYEDLKAQLSKLNSVLSENAHLKQLKSDVEVLLRRVALHGDEADKLIDLSFSAPDASELLKKLSLVYGNQPISVERNGLGRNNLLYVALVLSRLVRVSKPIENAYVCFRFVGIEEPEAHLHPHLQDHLASNIEAIRQEHDKTMQLVLTSHSAHIASKLSLANTAIMFNDGSTVASSYVLEGLDVIKHKESIRHLSLYLDATKSRMFFARRILLVEGICEQVLLEHLFLIHSAKTSRTLTGAGVEIVNVHGVAFSHFLTIVKNGYFRRTAVLTDSDSSTMTKERARQLKKDWDKQNLIEVFISARPTLERDLIAENKSGAGKQVLLQALIDTKPLNGKAFEEQTGVEPINEDKFFTEIEDYKAEFAFNLSKRIASANCGFAIPRYISNAFDFLCGDVRG